MSRAPCPVCGCQADAAAHAVVAALATDDIDRALGLGLLDCEPCPTCRPACTAHLLAIRAQRATALAARERYRARSARLQRRADERAARRASPPPAADQRPSLPPAAAAALARAKARAARKS